MGKASVETVVVDQRLRLKQEKQEKQEKQDRDIAQLTRRMRRAGVRRVLAVSSNESGVNAFSSISMESIYWQNVKTGLLPNAFDEMETLVSNIIRNQMQNSNEYDRQHDHGFMAIFDGPESTKLNIRFCTANEVAEQPDTALIIDHDDP